jgi:hypothetical protein
MATNPKDSNARKFIGKFARTLLATTCLTVAAQAGTITYTEGATLSNTSPGTPLAAATDPGTTIVTGFVGGTPTVEWFELTGLGIGTFTVSATTDNVAHGATISVFTDTPTLLESGVFTNGAPQNFGALPIPGDQNVVFEVHTNSESPNNWTVTVNTTSTTPEPGTLGSLGLGLAGALALRRKLKA